MPPALIPMLLIIILAAAMLYVIIELDKALCNLFQISSKPKAVIIQMPENTKPVVKQEAEIVRPQFGVRK